MINTKSRILVMFPIDPKLGVVKLLCMQRNLHTKSGIEYGSSLGVRSLLNPFS